MKLKPFGDRALLKMVEREEQEAGGIVLPDTAKKKPQTAEVIEVGKFENGIKVGAGDVVVLRKYAGVEIRRAYSGRGGVGCWEDEREGLADVKAHAGANTDARNPSRVSVGSSAQHRPEARRGRVRCPAQGAAAGRIH